MIKEGRMSGVLSTARKRAADEFYTNTEDIASEVEHYKDQFEGKVVYCNCDSPWSSFWRFFREHFHELGLKELYATGYNSEGGGDYGHYDGNKEETGKLQGSGSYDSDECLEILNRADIVCTNPPFSLFKSYLPLMMEHNVDVLLIGNQNAMGDKRIFEYFKEGRLFAGYGFKGCYGYFKNEHYDDFATNNSHKEGMIRVNGIMWYTTMKTDRQEERIELKSKYHGNEESYPKYNGHDIINVDKVSEIPDDYYGIIGVPITFLKKLNLNQFEVIGRDKDVNNNKRFSIGDEVKYARVLIRRRPTDTPEFKQYQDLNDRMNNL